METCHLRLNIPISPLSAKFKFPVVAPETSRIYFIRNPSDILNEQLITFFENEGLKMSKAVLFFKRHVTAGEMHTDIEQRNGEWIKPICAVNWNLSGASSTMKWFRTNLKEKFPDPKDSNRIYYKELNGILYLKNETPSQSETICVDRAQIEGPTLVRTDIPHLVQVTDTQQSRWALSIRFEPDFASWSEAFRTFQKFSDNCSRELKIDKDIDERVSHKA